MLVAVALLFAYRFWMSSLSQIYRGIILTLRGLLLAVMLLLLFDPQIVWTHNILRPPRIGVFLDNSLSMSHHPSASAATVFSQVTTVVDWANKNGYEPVIMTFGESVTPRENLRFTYNPDERLTSFNPLAEVWQKSDLAAGFLFSDGVATSGRDPSAVAGAPGFPIFTVGVGDTITGLDLSIADLRYPLSLLDQQPGSIVVTVRASNTNGRRSRLLIFQEDQLIYSEPIRIGSRDFVKDFEAPVVGRLDGPRFRVELMVLPEESNIDNNRRDFQIDVLPGQRQITLLTGALSPNSALLGSWLEETMHARVDRLTYLRGRWRGDAARFWSSRQHLVVLDNYPTSRLPEGHVERLLAKLQRERTPILVVVGPDNANRQFVRLMRSLGVRIRSAMDSLGVSHQLRPAAQRLGSGARRLNPERPGTKLPPVPLVHLLLDQGNRSLTAILEDDDGNRVISYGQVGSTKLGLLLVPNLSATHLKLSHASMGGYLEGIWKAIVEWSLEPEGFSQYVVQPDRRQYHLGEKVLLRGIVRDRAGIKTPQPFLTLEIDGPGGAATVALNYDFEDGEYKGDFWPAESGTYRLLADQPEGRGSATVRSTFHVQAGRVELETLIQNRYALERLAQATGGHYVHLQALEGTLSQLDFSAKATTRAVHYSIWQFSYLWVVPVILLGLEWILRRVAGLI